MSTNKLMEAAAEILSGSKSKAPTMPPAKLPGEEQDLGGPTPQDGKPSDESEKMIHLKEVKISQLKIKHLSQQNLRQHLQLYLLLI